MSKHFSLLFLFTILGLSLFGQEKYISHFTSDVVVETLTYASKDGQDLALDVYLPQNDPDTDRPLLLFVHGGGFFAGERNSESIVRFCNNLAEYGYVAASISYRLTRKGTPEKFGCDCPEKEKLATFAAAVEDIQDATYYLIQNSEYLGIDPYKIILAGGSAGAEAALMTAYTPPVCYDLPSGPVSYAGVIGLAGAIPDTTIIYKESAVPSMFFHGTDDNLVPYGTAPHHYCAKNKPGYIILHGSRTIASKLDKLAVPYWLHTTCGGGHELAGTPLHKYFDEIVDFCYSFVVKKSTEFRHTVVKDKEQQPNYKQYNYCEQ
ncbi:alpha/beta hydrolase family protein [Mariniphaga anaerophila]|nr:alpha/beta hydrolase [Mariniphaga anaerophila]